jgi:oligopeptide transport system ATP-binding protein
MVFQDPFSSLNPTMKLGEQVAEVLRMHKGITQREATARTLELFEAVRLPDAKTKLTQYPHEISGGQRQRVLLAMAFACSPALLIADEPTTALDVTVQAQILILLRELAAQSQCGVLLITHDLGVVAASCQRVLVMYAGQIVEAGTTSQILSSPRHPYTQGLLESLPPLDGERVERLRALPGQPPNMNEAVAGCAFYPRCAIGKETPCTTIEPQLLATGDGSHAVRCHYADTGPS